MLFITILIIISEVVLTTKSNYFQVQPKDDLPSKIIFIAEPTETYNLRNSVEQNYITMKNTGDGVMDLDSPSDKIISLKGNEELKVNSKVKSNAENIDFKMNDDDSKFEMEGVEQWQLWLNDDFNGWSNSTVTKCGKKMKILGGKDYENTKRSDGSLD